MTSKQIHFDHVAREEILRGSETLTNAVRVTLGPRGRNVVLDKAWGAPKITKDGVTVANELELDDKGANMGVLMVKEVASKTADQAGDGTTTATLLAHAILRDGIRLVTAGHDPMELKRGVDLAVAAVVEDLARQSRTVERDEEVAQIGTISANNDADIGRHIADAMARVGRDGVITVEESKGNETELEVVEGLQFDRGYLSGYFVTDPERMEAVLEDALVLCSEKKISAMADLLPLLEQVVRQGRSLLIIAEDVDGEALATLVVNRLRGTLDVAAVKAPAFGERRTELLRDIAVVTGGKAFTADVGETLEHARLEDLGVARRVTIGKEHTTIVAGGGKREDIDARANQIRRAIGEATSDYDRETLQERLAKLVGGVAILRVGAPTEMELQEKKDRVEDALHATKAAVEEGVVPGGGVALVRAEAALERLEPPTQEQRFGIDIVRRALEEPLRQIVLNAGGEPDVVAAAVRDAQGSFGYDAVRDEMRDLEEAGIMDPSKVVRVAIENAGSVAGMMLTTEAVVYEQPPAEPGLSEPFE